VTQKQNPPPPGGGSAPPATRTAQLPTVTARPPRRGGVLVGVTLIVAVLGLVVGLAGVAVAAIALGRSDKAVSLAGSARNALPPPPPGPAGGRPPAGPGGQPSTTAAAGTPDGADPSATPTEINPSAQFAVAYQDQHLRIKSRGCGYPADTVVDLDEPRVLGEGNADSEFGYADCSPGHIDTKLAFAQVTGPGATPSDCLEKIRTDPGRSPTAASPGLTLCFVTSQNDAASRGITQKLVFVTIDSTTVDDRTGVLNVTAKAWTVPQ